MASTYEKCVELFLAPSRFVRDKFVEHGWDSTRFGVLPHFQKVLPFRPPANGAPILYVGRLSEEKGIDDLIRAMCQVRQLHLVIAGEGPQRMVLEQLADSLSLANVKFVGQVSAAERDSLIAQSRFTVLPAHAYETLAKTILESYALGRPVVASDLGSRRELVRHGETGLLYRCGDVDALAQAIRWLTAAPLAAERMGMEGREWVRQRHSPEAHYQKLSSLYRSLIEKRNRVVTTVPRLPVSANLQLRIAFIGGRGLISKYSGIETYYEEVGQQLAQRGHSVTVYCRSHFTPAIPEHNGMKVVRLPTIRSKHLETLIHTFLCTAHALTQSYDVIHYPALGPALFALIPRLLGAKTVVTVQGLDWQRGKWGRVAATVLRLGEKASVHFPNETMVVSRALQQRYRELHRIETVYIPNGGLLRDRREPQRILDWDLQHGNYVLFLGRFSPEKGCHLLVEAFEQIETDVKLVMAGPSSYCDDYSRKLRQHASDRIRILDWVSGATLDELLTNAMIFVLPSDMEGLSLALLDAMGAGLCVLTTDVPENREAVEGAGFTFVRGDAADLAQRLQFLIANPAVREAAGERARKRIEMDYQWTKITEDIEHAYFQLLGRDSTAAPKKQTTRATAVGQGQTERRAS